MSRMTYKDSKYNKYFLNYPTTKGIVDMEAEFRFQDKCNNKLGQIEDLMEKYEIESVEKLEEILKDYDEMAKDIVEMGLGVKVDFKG